MIPTPTEKTLLQEYREERKRLQARLKHIESWMAQFTLSDEVVQPAQGLNDEVEQMPFTIRHAVRAYLKDAGVPKAAPEIAQAMMEHKFFPTYKKTKSNVDSTLSRMVGKELDKNDEGYFLKKTDQQQISFAA